MMLQNTISILFYLTFILYIFLGSYCLTLNKEARLNQLFFFVCLKQLSALPVDRRLQEEWLRLYEVTRTFTLSNFFQDASFGTSTKNCNHVLTELLRTLTLSSPYHRELARVVLIAAPDQIVHFLPTWKPGFVARASDKWSDMMVWLDSVYESLDVVSKLKKVTGKARVACALNLVLPPIVDRELQTDAFSEKQPVTVCVTFLKFLRSVLLRVYR